MNEFIDEFNDFYICKSLTKVKKKLSLKII